MFDRRLKPVQPARCRKVLLPLLATAICALPVQAAEDLLSVYQKALTEDPQYQAAMAERDAALERLPQSRAGLLPSVEIIGDVSRDRYDSRVDSGVPSADHRYATNETYSLELRQAVYQRARFKQLARAGHEVEQAEATFVAAQQDLVVRVAEQYFQLLAARDNLEFVTADKDAISVALEQARHRYEVGLAAPTDLYEAQARHDIAVSDELRARKLVTDAREALFTLTGSKLVNPRGLGAEVPLVMPDPADPERWVSMAVEQNPLLLAANAAVNAAQEYIQLQRSGHYPSLDLVANYQYRDNDFGGLNIPIKRNDKALGLQLNIPLYQGGLISSRTREASQQYQQARAQQTGSLRDAELLARESYRGVEVELSRVHALQQAILSNEKALEASSNGYEVGTRNITDVLDAQRELLRARRDHAASRYQYLLYSLQLKRAVGSLSEQDISAINILLQ